MPVILSRSANKTATSARVLLVEEIRGTYTVKSGKVKRNMVIKKASHGNPAAVIKLTGKPQPAIDFHHAKGGKGGAKLQVRNDKPFAAVISKRKTGGEKEEVRKAFIAQMPSGHKGIFQRQSGDYMEKSPRLKNPNISTESKHTERIKELLSPSPVKMTEIIYGGSSGISEINQAETGKLFCRYFTQQVELVLGGKQKRGGIMK